MFAFEGKIGDRPVIEAFDPPGALIVAVVTLLAVCTGMNIVALVAGYTRW